MTSKGRQPSLMRLSDISAPRQALVRLCQSINYGLLLGIVIRQKEPVFNPEPDVLVDVKLDSEGGERAETGLSDFDLSQEVCRLLDLLDEVGDGELERVEIRAGLPRRATVRRRLIEVRK